MLYLIIKFVASMSLDVYKDNIFSTRYDLVYLKTWNTSFSSASVRKVVQNLTLAFSIAWKYQFLLLVNYIQFSYYFYCLL